jgi:phage antirepressor YoqD-like protein/phage anti-repressor protein
MQYLLISEQEQTAIKTIVESQSDFPISLDDAWQWLGYTRKDSAKEKLVRNFEVGADYCLTQMAETRSDGTFSHRYELVELTVDCFKQLGMMAGTEKGKEVRKYFLQCEKELKTIKQAQPQLPGDYLAALKALVVAEEEKLILAAEKADLQSKVVELKPKAEIFDVIAASGNNLSMQETAKTIGVLGRNKLFEFLRSKQILMRDNTPYQQYINSGYFTLVQKPRPNQPCIVDTVLLVTPSGLEFIIRKLQAAGYVIPSAA